MNKQRLTWLVVVAGVSVVLAAAWIFSAGMGSGKSAPKEKKQEVAGKTKKTRWAGSGGYGVSADTRKGADFQSWFSGLPARSATNRHDAVKTLSSLVRTDDDIQQALAFWATLRTPLDRTEFLHGLIAAWAERDPRAAAAWVERMARESITVNRMKSELIHAIAAKWGESDPKAAAEWVMGIKDVSTVPAGFSAIVDAWSRKDPAAAWQWINSGNITGDYRMAGIPMAFSTWVNKDPVAALDAYRTLPDADKKFVSPYSLVSSLVKSDPVKALGLVPELAAGDADKSKMFTQMVFNVWSATDPRSALDYLAGAAVDDVSDVFRKQAVFCLAHTDPSSAIQYALKMSDKRQAEVFPYLLRQWAENDPAAALAWLYTQPADAPWQSERTRLEMTAAKDDPAKMLAVAASIADATERQAAMQQALGLWSQKEPQAVIKYLDGLSPDDPLQAGRFMAIAQLARRDPEAAIRSAKSIADEKQRGSLLTSIFFSLINSAPGEALKLIDEMPVDDAQKESFRASAIQRIAGSDIAKAVDMAAAIRDEKARASFLGSLVETWARTDLDAALAYVEGKGNDPALKNVMGRLALSVAETDLTKAKGMVEGMADGPERKNAMASLARLWGAVDPSAAASWLFSGTSGGVESADTMNELLRDWMWKDDDSKKSCVAWIVSKGMNYPPEVLKMFVERLTRADINAASEYAARLPSGEKYDEVRAKAIEMVIREMARVNGRRAAEMLASSRLELSSVVFSETVFNWADQDPAAAAAWVESMPTNRPERVMGLQEVYYQWRRKDPKAADEWQRRVSGR